METNRKEWQQATSNQTAADVGKDGSAMVLRAPGLQSLFPFTTKAPKNTEEKQQGNEWASYLLWALCALCGET